MDKTCRVDIKKLKNDAIIPTLGSEKAAGYDLYAYIDEYNPRHDDFSVDIASGEVEKIGTGISITPPPGYFAAILARSGLSVKLGLRPANCMGVCDEDYTGEYIVALYNDSNEERNISHGDRIAQVVFIPYTHVDFNIVDELVVTERANNGFGSTGNK